MRRIFGLAAVVLAFAVPAQAANGLLGKWVIAPGQDNCSIVTRIFTPNSETDTTRASFSYPAETSTSPIVRYTPSDATHLYVVGTLGLTNAMRWEFMDANHIRDTSFSDCVYQRTR